MRVRLLVDYNNYKRLDLFSLMERQGSDGAGSLRVRFYNRSSRDIIRDAVYMAMGCGKSGTRKWTADCSAEKFADIDRIFTDEIIDGKPVGNRDISNLNSSGSGLFRSGLFAKNANIMAFAVQQGQEFDLSRLKTGGPPPSAQDRENLK